MKYIVVTGGVVSGLGKGITISSIGRILKCSGVRVTAIKIDPYLNVDAGTMSPFEHGETFVLDDGGETDLDLGNYERFLDITLTGRHNITSGKIYQTVIQQERRGDYLGKTVQMVPHCTDLVQSWIREVAQISVDGSGLPPEVCLVEVGGTVGDIESMIFLEALRQFQFNIGRENILFVHVSLVPTLGSVGEQKTKPTQHSVKELRALGLSPDVIVCRSTEELSTATKNKMSIFCQVPPENIISVYDVSNIYHVPLILVEQKLDHILRNALDLVDGYPALDMQQWAEMAKVVDNLSIPVDIAIVGKYVGLHDSYLSLIKALKHSAIHLKLDVRLNWVEATNLEEDTKIKDPDAYKAAWETIRKVKGILVPGGFGIRGVAGKVAVVKYARENKIPLLGVCLGMQVMVIEYARSMLGWNDANSTEFSEQTGSPVVIFMPDINPNIMGGTMRLGSRKTIISTTLDDGKLSLGSEVYGYLETDVSRKTISERHRHRYEVNPEKVDALEKRGLVFSGRDETGQRMEIVELPRSVHPFFFGTQFHPEFRSRPNRPSPPFFAFVAASAGKELTKTEWSTAGKMWIEHELKIYRDIGSAASPVRDSRKRSLSDNQFSPRYSNTTSPGVLFALAEVTDNRHRNVGSAVQDPDVITKSPSAAGKPLKIAKTNEKSSCK